MFFSLTPALTEASILSDIYNFFFGGQTIQGITSPQESVQWDNTKTISKYNFTITAPRDFTTCTISSDNGDGWDNCTAYIEVCNNRGNFTGNNLNLSAIFNKPASIMNVDLLFTDNMTLNSGVKTFNNLNTTKPPMFYKDVCYGIKADYQKARWQTVDFNFSAKAGIYEAILDPTISACGTLSSAGTYTLTQDISAAQSCITIGANDIIIDGAGYTINYTTGAGLGYGINNTGGYDNITIYNLTITQINTTAPTSTYGIFLSSTTNDITLYNLTINTYASTSHGIYFNSGNRHNYTNLWINATGTTAYAIYENNGNQLNMTSSKLYGKNGVYMGGDNNILINNTIEANTANGIRFASSSNNSVSGGSIRTLGTGANYDYYIGSGITSLNFTNTNFTTRKVYFIDSTSFFNYQNDSAQAIQLITNSSLAPSYITRTYNTWSQSNMNWNDTNSSNGITITEYELNGMTANANYSVYNTSNGVTTNPYNLTADASGTLPPFQIFLNKNTNINVSLIAAASDTIPPTYSLNSTNSTTAGASISHNLYWQDETGLRGYIFSFDNGTGIMVNDSWTVITGIGNWSNITKSVNATAGTTIRWQVWANDTSNNANQSAIYSYVTTSGNTAPSTQTPIISPTTAYTADDLNCNATLTDAEQTSLTALYKWYKNGAINFTGSKTVSNATNSLISTLGNGNTTKSENWICEITPNDGTLNGTAVNSTARAISNTAPIAPSSLTLTDPVYVASTLTASGSGSTDADSDSLTYYYEFYNVNDSATVQAYSATATYTIQVSDAHDKLRVRTKAYDGTAFSAEYEANRSVSNTAPITPSITPTSNLNISSNSVNITCSGSTDADSDTIYYQIYGDTNANPNTLIYNNTGTAYTWSGLSEGYNYFKCRASDLTDASANTTAYFVVKDTLPPIMTIESPLNQTYSLNQNWVWANVTLSESGSWCGVSLNNTANRTMSNTSQTAWYLNLSVPSAGSNSVKFFCNDTVGNMAALSPFITNNGTQIDNFETYSAWTVGGTGASLANDTVHFKEGTQGIKLIATNGNAAFMTKTISYNFSNTSNFAFWVYLVNASQISNIAINIASTSDFSKYYVSPTSTLVEGWNRIVINKDIFTDTGHADSWNNQMIRIRPRLNMNTGGNASATFDDLTFDMRGRPKVIITFDDDDDSVLNNAYPIMQANGQKGVVFVPTSYPDNASVASVMNLTNLTMLYNQGWDISSHTVTHPSGNGLLTLSQAQMETELNDSYDWLMNNSFNKSAKFIAYPGGKYNQSVIEAARAKGYVLGRTVINGQRSAHFGIEDYNVTFQLTTINVANTTTVASIYQNINDTINQSGVLILTFHKILNGTTANSSIQYLTTDFSNVSAFLKNKSDAGLLDVVTMSNYYNYISSGVIFTTQSDTTPPSLTLQQPQNTTYSSTARTLNYTVLDTNLAQCWYQYNGTNTTLSNCANTTFTALNNQQSTLTLYANDTVGNLNSTTVFFTVDTQAPTSNTPSDATYGNGTSQNIQWILTDNLAAGYYTVYRNGTIQNASAAWTNNINLNVWVNTSTVGYWNYTIFFNDSVGNNGISDTVFINIVDTSDSTPPTLTIQSPTNTTYATNASYSPTPIWFNATVNEPALSVWFSADGGANISMSNSSGNWNTLYSALTNGQHSVVFYAEDLVGNMNQSEAVHFSINYTIGSGLTAEEHDWLYEAHLNNRCLRYGECHGWWINSRLILILKNVLDILETI